MKPRACLVEQVSGAYLLACLGSENPAMRVMDQGPDELAAAVEAWLEAQGNSAKGLRERIFFAPEPRLTLFAAGEIPEASRIHDRQHRKFLAETLLPLDAEQMAADFVIANKQLRVLAIDHDDIAPIVEAFHRRGLYFSGIAPTPILALEEAVAQRQATTGAIVWEEADHCDLWWLERSSPRRWSHLIGQPQERQVGLKLFATQVDATELWTLINASPATVELIRTMTGREPSVIELAPQSTLALLGAERIARGARTPWFDLRDGSIAGSDRLRPLYPWMKAASIAVMCAVLAVPLALWWKSSKLHRQVAAIVAAQEELYRNFEPNKPLPDDIPVTIAKQYLDTKGATNPGGVSSPTISAMEVLHRTLNAVSKLSDFSVTKLEVADLKLTFLVRLNHPGDVATLAQRLQQVGILVDEPNETSESDGSISARFEGKLGPPSAKSSADELSMRTEVP